ncbi:MAG TPA: V-type ATP synthase subunit B [Anaeromyxobacteraceae bacterium]|nr:V-type ATP synthase subunit B [Anaeromyxobacteraceae bacterium]
MKGLVSRRLRSATAVRGPLLLVRGARRARLGEIVLVRCGDEDRRGQVIEVSEELAAVQVLEETQGIAPDRTEVVLSGRMATLPVSRSMLGRTFDGTGRPADGLPAPVPEAEVPVSGAPMNVTRRAKPSECIETGISAIDGMNTLVRGQKLPVFSCAGLPASRLAAQIVRQARVRGGQPFAVVFAAIGAPYRECQEYLDSFSGSGALHRTVVFLNRADDPPVERLLTPRCALTCAEHLAFTHGMDVLVVLTDMTAYCDALREVALARDELPGRRGYPGYLYTDLASIFERAGRIAGRPGSVTQIPVLTMPDDDITHPVPDLTGYITEGQVVLSRDLDRKGVFPPVDVLPSLSRLMGLGTGAGKTREDHRPLADQVYAFHARGVDVRRMAAIVGAANLGDEERRFLEFSDRFERELIHQGGASRSLEETLAAAWRLLEPFPAESLTRIPPEIVARHRPAAEGA